MEQAGYNFQSWKNSLVCFSENPQLLIWTGLDFLLDESSSVPRSKVGPQKAVNQGIHTYNTRTGVLWRGASSLRSPLPLANSNCNQLRSLASVPLGYIFHSLHWFDHNSLPPVGPITRRPCSQCLVAISSQRVTDTTDRLAQGRTSFLASWCAFLSCSRLFKEISEINLL